MVEDERRRVDVVRQLFPEDLHLVHVRDGGRALGVRFGDGRELGPQMVRSFEPIRRRSTPGGR